MIVLLAVPFAVLAGGMFLILFSHTASAHQGASVDAKVGGGWWGAFKQALLVTNPLAVGIGTAIDWVFRHARGIVSHWALASVKPVARWFDGLNELFKRTYAQMSGNATDTADALQKMRHTVIPREATKAAAPALHAAKTATAKASTALAREHALSTTFSRTHAAQVKHNVHYSHAIDVAIPKQLGRINTREEKLSRDQTALRERTTSLENGAVRTFEWLRDHPFSAVTGVFAGAVAVALTRLGWGVFRCRSWQGLGRRLTCGMGTLLEDILFGLIDVLVIADLCQITTLMVSTAESSIVQTPLRGFVAGIDELLLCQNVNLPPALVGYWTSPPPTQAFSALPAA